jgi:hypothetical protein
MQALPCMTERACLSSAFKYQHHGNGHQPDALDFYLITFSVLSNDS